MLIWAKILQLRDRLWPSRLAWLRRRHLRLGRQGENAACRMLENAGVEVLCRNYRHGRAEIDIVARDGPVLCFIEVKTRRSRPGVRPAEAVDAGKRRRILWCARHYLHAIAAPGLERRFDIIEVTVHNRRLQEIRHWKDCFRETAARAQT
ncbi:MAG: YraN family protein [Oligosphaeraceae bacterium]|nr:YraN family protein [Oligosphaeraceae bacterium]